MNIAVNTRFLLKGRLEGIGWFTYETLKRITRQHPEHHFFFLFDRPYSQEFIFEKNVTPVVVYPPTRHPLLLYLWFEWRLPAVLKKIRADLFISTDNFLSVNAKVKTMLVVHDLAFIHYPQHIPFFARLYYKYFSPQHIKKANRIATVSEYTKTDLIKTFNVAPDKIDVVYNGSAECFKPFSAMEKEAVRAKYTLGKEYFLFVGALHPRKNISGLLSAFELFKKNSGADIKLVIAGRMAWGNKEMLHVYENMENKQDVIFLGHCNQQVLSEITGAAMAMVYVSFFEGFGIPVLEALKCAVPVIISDASSLPEVAGEGGLKVDPGSTEEIANAMQRLYENPSLREALAAKGLIHSKQFSWDATAEKLWKSVEKTF